MTTQAFTVILTSSVSTVVEVEIETDGLTPDEIREAAEEAAYPKIRASLCHQCASDMDMAGDWEAQEVEQS